MIKSDSMAIIVDVHCIEDIFKKDLELILEDRGGFGKLEYLYLPKKIQDSTTSILIKNKKNKKIAVLLCAKSENSKNIERNVVNAQKAKRVVPGNAILDHLFYQVKEGISCAAWPYCEPLSENSLLGPIQRRLITPSILKWLRDLTQNSLKKASLEEQNKDFIIPLENLASNKKIDKELHVAIKQAIDNCQKNSWVPQFVLAHNDLRKCNILHGCTRGSSFTVIDWAGAQFNGYAIYDLVCISSSLNISPERFVGELREHCRLLGCDIKDATSYLLASLANLGMNLECFPEESYSSLVKFTTDYLLSGLSYK
jgi:thiamine kinase-like enzyme